MLVLSMGWTIVLPTLIMDHGPANHDPMQKFVTKDIMPLVQTTCTKRQAVLGP